MRRITGWILGKKLLTERVVRHWSRLSREVMDSLSLEACKEHIDVVLRNVV